MHETYTYLASRIVDFTDDKGRLVKGRTLYFFRPAYPGDSWVDHEVFKTFVADGHPVLQQIPSPLTDVFLTFNRYGKIINIENAEH